MKSFNRNKIAITDGLLFVGNQFKKGTVLIKNDKIEKVIFTNSPVEKLSDYNIVNAENSYVSYGFFDPHVHFRTPGNEEKEDWISGSKAAIHGGFTYVSDMPNNNPSATTFETLKIKNEIAKKSPVNYGFYLGLSDKNSHEIHKIYKRLKKSRINILGIKAFIGSSTGDLLINDFDSISKSLNDSVYTLVHCEDNEVLRECNNIKYRSIFDHEKMRPAYAEVSGINKIIKSIGKNKKPKLYICHVSSYDLVKRIEELKEDGYNITTEITPHHLYFNTEDIKESNIYKINPPIRNKNDVDEIRRKFNEGFFDIIGTDHAPHLLKEKESANPPSGMPGLESAFYALYSLYENNHIKLENIFKLLTSGYRLFNIKKRGKIEKGYFADITIIKKENFIFNTSDTYTKADFSPFDGLSSNCRIDTVLINGAIVLDNGKIV